MDRRQTTPVRALPSRTVTMSPPSNAQLTDNMKFNIDALVRARPATPIGSTPVAHDAAGLDVE
jgi:hypothetical protein